MAGRFMEQAANRDYSKWWQAEGSIGYLVQKPKPPIEGRPHDIADNYVRAATGNQPFWIPVYGTESNTIWPDAMEEHPVPEVDGYDWWGVNWIMEKGIGGMITKPGTRTISTFAKWQEELEWPDLSLVDFAADGKKLSANLDPQRVHVYQCVEGIFERLHELIPFDESLLAFYEEPELLDAFFNKMADYKIESCGKIIDHYGRVDGVLYHDDWGTERAGFFSNEMFEAQLFPPTKRLMDYLHTRVKFIELHSCGRNMQYVPLMIRLGINVWTPQARCNDLDFLYDTYGDRMTFTIPLRIRAGLSSDERKAAVRAYVDRYAPKGRVLCMISCEDRKDAKEVEAELVAYSYAFYNKLYGRA